MVNVTQRHDRCLSDNHLAAAESKWRTKDAAKYHHQQLRRLRSRSSPRRYSFPPWPVPCPSTEQDDTRTEARLTTPSGEQHQEMSHEMSTLLSAVENLLRNLLVRCVFVDRSKSQAALYSDSLGQRRMANFDHRYRIETPEPIAIKFSTVDFPRAWHEIWFKSVHVGFWPSWFCGFFSI